MDAFPGLSVFGGLQLGGSWVVIRVPLRVPLKGSIGILSGVVIRVPLRVPLKGFIGILEGYRV